MKYFVVHEWTVVDFSDAVQDHLKMGWVLYGSPFYFMDKGTSSYNQAMTKVEDGDGDDDAV